MKRLLVLTNGAGEDAIAARILDRLPREVAAAVVCCPLVGEGSALAARFELAGPRVLPPSEGLFRESWRLAARDLWDGVIAGHARQLTFLRSQREQVGLVVAVGDLFPVLWAALAGFRPLFVGTAKSVHHHPYSWPERWLLRRYARSVLVRDQATADRLRQQGVEASWLGNAMMDEVTPTGRPLPLAKDGPLITLLPGSRKQAAEVLPFQLRVLLQLKSRIPDLQAAVAGAPGMDPKELTAGCREDGWSLHGCPGEGAVGLLDRHGWGIPILLGRLGDLLARSTLALGQAGTANEQAAGAGVPVVAYDSRGESGLRWYRKRQKGLLGDAVKVVPQSLHSVAREVELLLANPQERERRGAIGRERMGPAGGSQRMADAIAALWSP